MVVWFASTSFSMQVAVIVMDLPLVDEGDVVPKASRGMAVEGFGDEGGFLELGNGQMADN